MVGGNIISMKRIISLILLIFLNTYNYTKANEVSFADLENNLEDFLKIHGIDRSKINIPENYSEED